MEKIVYFLGAGFSQPLGIPVMGNFLEKSKDLYFERPEDFEHFLDIFDQINKMHVSKTYYDTDLLNIEEILSILEMRNQLTGTAAVAAFTKYISDVVDYYTPKAPGSSNPDFGPMYKIFGDEIFHGYGAFLLGLFHIHLQGDKPRQPGPRDEDIVYTVSAYGLKDPDYSIITLNYDLALENICKHLNEGMVHNVLKLVRKSSSEPLPAGQIYLAKLHGSIDTEDIVPPTWNKNLAKESIISSWRLAHKLLSDANQIRIIGYSLPETDSYIKYLLRAAVLDSPNLKRIDVICLDDVEGKVKQRYKDFIIYKNYRFKSMDVRKYLANLFPVRGGWPHAIDINIEAFHNNNFMGPA